jgi:hypothetical protein
MSPSHTVLAQLFNFFTCLPNGPCRTGSHRTHTITPSGRELKIYKTVVRTSQETHHVSATETNRLMLFGETVAVYCENHTEHTNTLCEYNVQLLLMLK